MVDPRLTGEALLLMQNKWKLLTVCGKINGTDSASIHHAASAARSICVCAFAIRCSPESKIVLEPLNTQINLCAVPKRQCTKENNTKSNFCYTSYCCVFRKRKKINSPLCWRPIQSKQHINLDIKIVICIKSFVWCMKMRMITANGFPGALMAWLSSTIM